MAKKKEEPKFFEIMEDYSGIKEIIPPYNKLIPTNIEYTISEEDIVYQAVKIWLEYNKTVLIKWPKWTWKTSVVQYLCQELQLPLLYMQFTWTTSIDDFTWHYLIKDWSTYWNDWILATAMREGYVLLLDEANMPPWDITAILHSVMDDRKILVQSEKKEWDNVIKAHTNFRIVATINPSDEWNYIWTKEMNESLLDRFKIVVEAEYPTLETEIKILENKKGILFNDIDKTFDNWNEIKSKYWVLTRMCKIAQEVRNLANNDYTLSTRNLIDWAELCNYLPIIKAYEMSFKNKIDKDSEKEITPLISKSFSEKEYLIIN